MCNILRALARTPMHAHTGMQDGARTCIDARVQAHAHASMRAHTIARGPVQGSAFRHARVQSSLRAQARSLHWIMRARARARACAVVPAPARRGRDVATALAASHAYGRRNERSRRPCTGICTWTYTRRYAHAHGHAHGQAHAHSAIRTCKYSYTCIYTCTCARSYMPGNGRIIAIQ